MGKMPSLDAWLQEAKAHESAPQVGMYLSHNGVVRQSPRALVRRGEAGAKPVTGMDFSYDPAAVNAAVEAARKMEGIFYVRVWLNQGHLQVGDDIMLVLIGGDIRPHVMQALDALVSQIKNHCVREIECSD